MSESPPTDPIRVVIMSHSAIANCVLGTCLGRQPDLEPVKLGRRYDLSQIDVMLVHAFLSSRLRDALIAAARSAGGVKLVLVGAPSDPRRLASFLQMGFDGYVKTGEPYDTLLDVVRRVARGEVRLEAEVLAVVLERIRSQPPGRTVGVVSPH